MERQSITFATVVKNGEVKKIGKSVIVTPAINFKGGSIKWFDDSQLIRK